MFRRAEQRVVAAERAPGWRVSLEQARARRGAQDAAHCSVQPPARNLRCAAPGNRYASAFLARCRRVRSCRAQLVRSPDAALHPRTAGWCALHSATRQVVGDRARRSTSCGDQIGPTMRPKRCRCRMACMVICDDRRAHPAHRRSPPPADRSCRRVATAGDRQAWLTARLARPSVASVSRMRIATGARFRAAAS